MKIELGSKVKDTVTGFTGIAVGRYTYLSGCDHICVQPQSKKPGELIDAKTFDEPMLEVLAPPKPQKKKEKINKRIGGPRPAPGRPHR